MSRVLTMSRNAIAVGLITPLPVAAALAPGTVEKMKAAASDVLKIEILRVQEIGNSSGLTEVVYHSRILDVRRSKFGAAVGQSIDVESYHDTRRLPPPGPRRPPILRAGWKGTIYLKHKAKGRYRIAVYGHSFEANQ